MNKLGIFEDIVQIMHHDYAGYKDKWGVDSPARYREELLRNPDLDDFKFLDLVRDYLLDFRDRHVVFSSKNQNDFSNGFTVRRYRNKLFVTQVTQETSLEVGDALVALDGKRIEECATHFARNLLDDCDERQSWSSVIKKSETCTIESSNGEVRTFILRKYSVLPRPARYTYKSVDKRTCMLSLSDFANEGAIKKLLEDHDVEISHRENLIIDVRHNDGGNDTAFLTLLRYVFPNTFVYRELSEGETIFINYTERNCENRLAEFRKYLQFDLDDLTSEYLRRAMHSHEENRGKGFVALTEDFDLVIEGQANPKRIFVLSDTYCSSSGDMFVSICKRSPKVTVVGRNTLGVADYSNLAKEDYGDYVFLYPTSRTSLIDCGLGINGKGVDVDTYIPWTPAHLKEDVDLNHVLELCR